MLFLFFTFFIQEPILSSFALSRVLHSGVPAWHIHILYIAATSLSIFLGHAIGFYIAKHYRETKVCRFLYSKLSVVFPENAPFERHVTLFLLGPLIFPVTALLTPLVGFSFKSSYFILLFSELVFWYTAVWGIVLGLLNTKGLSFYHLLLLLPVICMVIFRRYLKMRIKKTSEAGE